MYVKELDLNSTDSHQTSPAYVLTFVRWDVRDTSSISNKSPDALKTRNPLVVYNDAISVNVSYNKSSICPSMQAILLSGDINYSTAVAPGDFVFVNMVNWETKAQEIRDRAIAGKPINKFADGFKGVFKVQTVSRNLTTSPEGVKSYTFNVTASGFTELNTVLYYNPALAKELAGKPAAVAFPILFGDFFTGQGNIIRDAGVNAIDLFAMTLGASHRVDNANLKSIGDFNYTIPKLVASLLGKTKAQYVNELYNLLVGIWTKSSVTNSPQKGFNPNFSEYSSCKSGNVFTAPSFKLGYTENQSYLQGWYVLNPQDWNGKTVHSIFSNYTNEKINEMYTSYRVDPSVDAVVPTIIVRQKPFTNPNFKFDSGVTSVPTSNFLDLPRWKISPDLVLSYSFSKNDALRINFVQVYTRQYSVPPEVSFAQQLKDGNYQINTADINRHGVRSYMTTSDADFPAKDIKTSSALSWTNLVNDWVSHGHLKETGTISLVGIQDPIAVGDNVEFNGVVYHIESISHQFQVNNRGHKMFRTNLSLTYGIDISSDSNNLLYPEMQFTDRFSAGKDDWNKNKLLPGFSDTQDITGRDKGEEIKETKEAPFQTRKGVF